MTTTPQTGRSAVVNSTTVRPSVTMQGSGPDLVLLHGWGLHSGIWDVISEQLGQHFRLHKIDLPGFGLSPVPSRDYDLELLVEQILSVAPANAHYLGWSLGGLVAAKIAASQPYRVERLITVASTPKFVQGDDWQAAMKPNLMDSFCRYLEEDYEGTLIRFLAIQALGSETQKDDIKRLKETVFIHGQPAKKALRGGLAILQSTDLRDEYASIKQPFLRIYGRLDSLVPAAAAESIQSLVPGSEHLVIGKASHAPFLSNKQKFVGSVIEFLEDSRS